MNTKEVARWVRELSSFMRPNVFLDVVRESAVIPNDRLFNDPALQVLQEAWAAGHFAVSLERLYWQIEVRTETVRFPDFYLRIYGREYEFEFTMADKPERRLGKEHKESKHGPLRPIPYQPARGGQEGPLWIADKVRKKYERHYSNCPHLLLYANFEARGLDPVELEAECRHWASRFSSIWVLWNNNLNDLQYLQLYDSGAFGKTDRIWHSVGVKYWLKNR